MKTTARKQALIDASNVLRCWAGFYEGGARNGMLNAADVIDPRVAVKPMPGRWHGDCAPRATAEDFMKTRGTR